MTLPLLIYDWLNDLKILRNSWFVEDTFEETADVEDRLNVFNIRILVLSSSLSIYGGVWYVLGGRVWTRDFFRGLEG